MRVARIDAQGSIGGGLGSVWIAQDERGFGQSLERGQRLRVALERRAKGARGFGRIAHVELLAPAYHVGIARAHGGAALHERLHERARQAVDAAVLLVAQLRAFVPGVVRLDDVAVREGDGVGARRGERAHGTGKNRGRGAAQARVVEHVREGARRRATTFGVAPPSRK